MRKTLAFLAVIILAQASWAISAPVNCQGNKTSTTTASITSFVLTTPGDAVFVWTSQNSAVASASIADTGSGGSQSYPQAGSYSNGPSATRGGMFIATNVTSALNGATITATWSAGTSASIVACEVPGAATSSLVDSTVNSSGSSATSLTSGSLTTSNANDLLVYCVETGASSFSSPVAGTSYTLVTGTGLPVTHADCQYTVVSATQSGVTTSMSWTGSPTNISGFFMGLKASGSVSASIPEFMLLGIGP